MRWNMVCSIQRSRIKIHTRKPTPSLWQHYTINHDSPHSVGTSIKQNTRRVMPSLQRGPRKTMDDGISQRLQCAKDGFHLQNGVSHYLQRINHRAHGCRRQSQKMQKVNRGVSETSLIILMIVERRVYRRVCFSFLCFWMRLVRPWLFLCHWSFWVRWLVVWCCQVWHGTGGGFWDIRRLLRSIMIMWSPGSSNVTGTSRAGVGKNRF